MSNWKKPRLPKLFGKPRAAGGDVRYSPDDPTAGAPPADADAAPNDLDEAEFDEHSLTVHVPLTEAGLDGGDGPLDLMDIEDPLIEAIEAAGFEYEGHLIGPREIVLYMHGKDADELFETARPVIESLSLPSGVWAVKQYGSPMDPDVREVRVDL